MGNRLKIKVKVAKADRPARWSSSGTTAPPQKSRMPTPGRTSTARSRSTCRDEEDVEGKATFTVTVKNATGKKLTEVDGSFIVK